MRQLTYLASARQDPVDILYYIAHASGDPTIAHAFVAKLQAKCRTPVTPPGTLGQWRPELGPTLHSTP